MRIFVGIDLSSEVRARIEHFVKGVEGFAPEARWMRPESLHITLKFVGEQPQERVEAMIERLRQVESCAFEIHLAGHGFFPTATAPRVFWIGIQACSRLAELAEKIDATMAALGIPREDRPYSPHLTLARAGGKSGAPKSRKGDGSNSIFAKVQKRLAAMSNLDFGAMMASDFILYQSQLSSGGSKYTMLHRFPLRTATS
jgi:RNA 2',3'-cyclic 3'-phosphodiesterase